MSKTQNYNTVVEQLAQRGYYLDVSEDEYRGVTLTPLFCHDADGYKYKITYDQVLRSETKMVDCFAKGNPFTLDNINKFIKQVGLPFECISKEYLGNRSPLTFRCLRCGAIIQKTWCNFFRNDERRHYIVCPNCDTRTESLHASVLKQIFLHEHPDTIVEDPSFRNPVTNKICPTDIVNHRLRIAIEVQSQWHDFPDIAEKDRMKKQYWIDNGYKFYAPDIRD